MASGLMEEELSGIIEVSRAMKKRARRHRKTA